MITVNDKAIEDLTAIYHMALGLERWFPNNNSAFAYGTRLCEETGELVEALLDVQNKGITPESKHHLIKEIEDVLQIITGVLGIYNLNQQLPDSLTQFTLKQGPHKITKDSIIAISVRAGQFADAINHMENQGIKKQKRGDNPDDRLLAKTRAFISQIVVFIEKHDLTQDLEVQIKADYLHLLEKGFIVQAP
jgi:NTP pyrophosphatase (non-canonical NTP hydrolase)